jgi:hypothetical protein
VIAETTLAGRPSFSVQETTYLENGTGESAAILLEGGIPMLASAATRGIMRENIMVLNYVIQDV